MFHQTQEFISRHRYFSSLCHFESEKLWLSNSNVNHFIRCCDAGDVDFVDLEPELGAKPLEIGACEVTEVAVAGDEERQPHYG